MQYTSTNKCTLWEPEHSDHMKLVNKEKATESVFKVMRVVATGTSVLLFYTALERSVFG